MDQRAQNNRSEQSDGCLGFHVDWPLGSKGTWQGMLRIHSLIQISVAHVLSKCSPSAGTLLPLTPVFLNQVYLRSPRMKLEFFSATAWKLFCWVWLPRICIMKSIGILNVLFQKVSPRPPSLPHLTPSYFDSHCCEPLSWTLTTHRSHRKCSTVLWGGWAPNLRDAI